MASLDLVLLIASFICLLLAAMGVNAPPRVSLGWAGLALYVATLIF